MDKNLFVLT